MTLIDAYGLVALVADEAAAAQVEGLLREDECRVVATNLAEAAYICQREHGLAAQDVRGALEPLILSGRLALAVSDEPETWLAAEIRARHYHRKQCPVSLADCFLLSHAIVGREAIATSDPAVAKVGRAEGVEIVALPDRDGNSPW